MVTDNTDKISLETIYTECNSHLREMDKNRDQIISFYIILVGAFLAVIKGNAQAYVSQELALLSTLILSILGILVSAIVNEFRKWHTRYSYTAVLLVALGREKRRGPEKIEKEVRADIFSKSHITKGSKFSAMNWFFRRYLWGTEYYTYLASLLITLIPIYLFLEALIASVVPNYVQAQSNYPFRVEILILMFVYFLFCHIISARHLYSEFSKCPWATWLISQVSSKFDFTYSSR